MSITNNNGVTCSLTSGVKLDGMNLVIHLDQLEENVLLTHRPDTATNLQWEKQDIDEITVHVPKKIAPHSKKIRVQLVGESFYFTHPLLTNKAGHKAIKYEGLNAEMAPDSKSAIYILFRDISTPKVRHGSVWLNTSNGVPFDPTVIIKKPPT